MGARAACGIIACREASLASNSADRFLMSESCLKVFFCSVIWFSTDSISFCVLSTWAFLGPTSRK